MRFKIHTNVIFPVVLCGCEILLFNLREEHKLKRHENRLLQRMFGLEGEDVMGGQRKLHWRNNALHNLNLLPSISYRDHAKTGLDL
jgi:hypothetical protein